MTVVTKPHAPAFAMIASKGVVLTTTTNVPTTKHAQTDNAQLVKKGTFYYTPPAAQIQFAVRKAQMVSKAIGKVRVI